LKFITTRMILTLPGGPRASGAPTWRGASAGASTNYRALVWS